MGEYSKVDDHRIIDVVNIIRDEIVKRFQPASIIIAGGFGRGEASFLEEDGEFKALSDCEVAIVSNRSISRRQIAELSRELTRQTDMEVVISNSLLLRAYTRFSVPAVVSRKVWRPSIQHYDLKEGSKVVYGQNILTRLPSIRPEEIPLWEGIRLMFNRMAASLSYFPVGSTDIERSEAIYWINKVIIACQDALLLSRRYYHYSYEARNLMLQELFPGHFSELNIKIPKFLPLAARAAEYKLRPEKGAYTEDLSELWFDTAEICDEVFRYIIKKDMGFTFNNYADFQQKYLKHSNVRKKYYLGVISSPLVQNIGSARRMVAAPSYRFPPPNLIRNIRTPWKHFVYSLVPLVYFGISKRGKINESQLKQARDTMSLFKKMEPKRVEPWQEWRYLKEQTIDLWHAICY